MKVSVIIPVFNEKRTVAEIIRRVLSARLPTGFSREVLVVDDASFDGTAEVLKRLPRKVVVLRHLKNLGKGAAIRTALGHTCGELILIQDADLEYNPADYMRLLSPFISRAVHVVYGSRLIGYPLRLTGTRKTPLPLHFLANKFLTLLTNALYGRTVTDMETGYKVFRRKVLAGLSLRANRFDFEPEVTAKLLRQKIPIVEIPITVVPRSYRQGKKIGWRDGLVAIWTLFKYRLVYDSR